MRPAGRKTAIGVILDAAEEPSTITTRAVEWSGNDAGLVLIAEAEKAVVALGVFLIDADVEVVSTLLPHGIGKKVEAVSCDVGVGIQVNKCSSQGVDIRDYVACKGHAAQACRIARCVGQPSLPRVENLSGKSRIAAAIKCGKRRSGIVGIGGEENLSTGVELFGEISGALQVRRHGRG